MERPKKKQKLWSTNETQILQQAIEESLQDATTKIILDIFRSKWKNFISNGNPTDQDKNIQRTDASIQTKIDEIKKGGRKLRAKWSNQDISFLLQCFPEVDNTKEKYRRTEEEFNKCFQLFKKKDQDEIKDQQEVRRALIKFKKKRGNKGKLSWTKEKEELLIVFLKGGAKNETCKQLSKTLGFPIESIKRRWKTIKKKKRIQ
jgi:hypothetical protein